MGTAWFPYLFYLIIFVEEDIQRAAGVHACRACVSRVSESPWLHESQGKCATVHFTAHFDTFS